MVRTGSGHRSCGTRLQLPVSWPRQKGSCGPGGGHRTSELSKRNEFNEQRQVVDDGVDSQSSRPGKQRQRQKGQQLLLRGLI